jgi:hypothetical protein
MKNLLDFSKVVALGIMLTAGTTASLLIPDTAEARQARGTTRTSVNSGASRNANTNRSTDRNVNRDVSRDVNRNTDIDIDVDNDYHGGHHDDYDHPIAAGMAVGAAVGVTAAIIGSTVYTLPPACTEVVVGGMAYQQCGSTWYQPQMVGNSMQYVVVNPPY